MKRIYDNTILLYRIIPIERYIEFVVTQNDENAIKSVTENDIIKISFDELLNNTIEFHDSFPRIKAIISEHKLFMRKSKEASDLHLKTLDAFYTDSNFIINFYINRCKNIIQAEHSYTSHKEWQRSKSDKTQNRIDLLLDNIETVTNPDYFSRYYNYTEAGLIVEPDFLIQEECGRRHSVRANLFIQNSLISYNVSYFTLVDFYNDFAEYLYREHEHIFRCEKCGKYFFGKEDRLHFCSAPECQKEYKRKYRNLKEVERTNSPEKKPITSVDNYISTMKSKFKKKINNDPQLLSEFEIEESIVKEDIRREVKRRKIEHEPFDDDTMDSFVRSMKYDISNLIRRLVYEYNNR